MPKDISQEAGYNASRSDLRNVIDIDPDIRGFSGMTDQQVAEDLRNQRVLDGPVPQRDLYVVMLDEKHRSNQGLDNKAFQIFARMEQMRTSAAGDDTYGRYLAGGEPVAPAGTADATAEWIGGAIVLRELLVRQPDQTGFDEIVLTDQAMNNLLNDLVAGEVMSNGDKNTIQDLSLNRWTGAEKWGLGSPNATDVANARAEP